MQKAILENNLTGTNNIDIPMVIKAFQNTRKHKRYNRIVADSFIAKSAFNDETTYTLVNMKNSKIEVKTQISETQALEVIDSLDLYGLENEVFENANTWRTITGWEVVNKLLTGCKTS